MDGLPGLNAPIQPKKIESKQSETLKKSTKPQTSTAKGKANKDDPTKKKPGDAKSGPKNTRKKKTAENNTVLIATPAAMLENKHRWKKEQRDAREKTNKKGSKKKTKAQGSDSSKRSDDHDGMYEVDEFEVWWNEDISINDIEFPVYGSLPKPTSIYARLPCMRRAQFHVQRAIDKASVVYDALEQFRVEYENSDAARMEQEAALAAQNGAGKKKSGKKGAADAELDQNLGNVEANANENLGGEDGAKSGKKKKSKIKPARESLLSNLETELWGSDPKYWGVAETGKAHRTHIAGQTSALFELYLAYANIREYEMNPPPPLQVDGAPNPIRVGSDRIYSHLMGTWRMMPNRLGIGAAARAIWAAFGIIDPNHYNGSPFEPDVGGQKESSEAELYGCVAPRSSMYGPQRVFSYLMWVQDQSALSKSNSPCASSACFGHFPTIQDLTQMGYDIELANGLTNCITPIAQAMQDIHMNMPPPLTSYEKIDKKDASGSTLFSSILEGNSTNTDDDDHDEDANSQDSQMDSLKMDMTSVYTYLQNGLSAETDLVKSLQKFEPVSVLNAQCAPSLVHPPYAPLDAPYPAKACPFHTLGIIGKTPETYIPVYWTRGRCAHGASSNELQMGHPRARPPYDRMLLPGDIDASLAIKGGGGKKTTHTTAVDIRTQLQRFDIPQSSKEPFWCALVSLNCLLGEQSEYAWKRCNTYLYLLKTGYTNPFYSKNGCCPSADVVVGELPLMGDDRSDGDVCIRKIHKFIESVYDTVDASEDRSESVSVSTISKDISEDISEDDDDEKVSTTKDETHESHTSDSDVNSAISSKSTTK